MPKSIFDIRRFEKDDSIENQAMLFKDKEAVLELLADAKRKDKKKRGKGINVIRLIGGFLTLVIVIALGAAAVYGYTIWSMKGAFLYEGRRFYQNFASGIGAVGALEFSLANGFFKDAHGSLAVIEALIERYRIERVANVIGGALPSQYRRIGDMMVLFDDVRKLSAVTIGATEKLAALQESGLELFLNKRGIELYDILSGFKGDLGVLKETLPRVQANVFELNRMFSQIRPVQERLEANFLTADIWLLKAEIFLGSLMNFLSGDGEKHMLVIFQNPSEIRPTGGFIGSYADVAFEKSGLTYIDVRDIYDPDGQLDQKIVPPKQLQTITKNWGARDANWFFDFPTSMEKLFEFLEASKIYKEENIAFEGAIAINTDVIEDVLAIVGPIEMPEYGFAIDASNFLEEVQREVESGADKKKGESKRILKLLAPRLFEKIANLDVETKRALIEMIVRRGLNKDIMLYFRNHVLEAFIDDVNLSGKIYDTPQGFRGDYLAVVNANIAGGKTDAVMRQKVALESRLDRSGIVENTLRVTRTHTGKGSRYSWYRAVNQNFIKVYTPSHSRLAVVSGFSKKRIPEMLKLPAGFRQDLYVKEMEAQAEYRDDYYTDIFNETGKLVFGVWLNTEAGDDRTLEVRYELGHRISVADGSRYEFILEKQSGVESEYEIIVYAPDGYAWEESGAQEFYYRPPETFRREIVRLTMRKVK